MWKQKRCENMAGKKTQLSKVKYKFQIHYMNFHLIFFAHGHIELCQIITQISLIQRFNSMYLLATRFFMKSVIFKIYEYTFNDHSSAQYEPYSPLNSAKDLLEGLNFTINFLTMQQKSELWVDRLNSANRLVNRLEFDRLEPNDSPFLEITRCFMKVHDDFSAPHTHLRLQQVHTRSHPPPLGVNSAQHTPEKLRGSFAPHDSRRSPCPGS